LKKTLAFSVLILATMSAQAADQRIPAGYDTWQTVGGGATHMKFFDEPIPADFFCQGSAAFSDRINFEGVPLATDPPGLFGRTDTIVARLDEVVLQEGMGHSRLQVKAMHLASRDVLENACGSWQVTAGLTKDQPITTIDYFETGENTGVYNAELVLSVALTFVNLDDPTVTRSLQRTVHFTEFIHTPYRLRPDLAAPDRFGKRSNDRQTGYEYSVDSDADGLPDTVLAFAEFTYDNGFYCEDGAQAALNPDGDPSCIHETAVHQAPDHDHVTVPTDPIIDKNPCKPSPCFLEDPGSGGGLGQRNRAIDGQMSEYDRRALLDRMRDLEVKGSLVITAEQLADEVFAKGN